MGSEFLKDAFYGCEGVKNRCRIVAEINARNATAE
jgi:hypothetical protein